MTNFDRVGKEQERAIVKWARTNGFPHADRIVRAGAGKNYGHRADEGDIWLTPGIIAQSKRLSPVNRAERAIPRWLTETEAQRVAANADLAILVVRREGTTDIGEWWAWLPLHHVYALRGAFISALDTAYNVPVRFTVADATTLIRTAGYGTTTQEEAA